MLGQRTALRCHAPRAARPYSTEAAARLQLWHVSGVATLGLVCAAATWYFLAPATPAEPAPDCYAPLQLVASGTLPSPGSQKFDVNDMNVHRYMLLRSQHASGVSREIAGPFAADAHDPRRLLAIYSYYIQEPSLQIERPYTPLSLFSRNDPSTLLFLYKRYASGEVSRYLNRLPPGASVRIRGPIPTWYLSRNTPIPNEIVMIVAGTGICTATQLLSNVFGTAQDRHALHAATPKITVLYAAQALDTLELLPELAKYEARFPDHVRIGLWSESVAPGTGTLSAPASEPISARVDALLGRHKSWWNVFGQASAPNRYALTLENTKSLPLVHGRIGKDDLARWCEPGKPGERIVLVCGPDGIKGN
ncbi:cytochrome-b5 reductase [Malassezia vespertilionis]|uniref:FAD-binding FR-type domain-containing protein n=1 Tax=Malassezia vespertilionis TaxID=2020962 RepID=A0A2N1JDX3_9BASI|nr:cytochrome-b5 reductase [Malassezia vespertilionis]PKI84749.1 hypothetical protein MVES_001080 [Malassezia vespertilionis]WFD05812.1 cytochrome-b5 reductase [Malassezia vespertilionis]